MNLSYRGAHGFQMPHVEGVVVWNQMWKGGQGLKLDATGGVKVWNCFVFKKYIKPPRRLENDPALKLKIKAYVKYSGRALVHMSTKPLN